MVATHGHSYQNVVFILFDSLIREYNVLSQEKDATNQMAMGVRQTPSTTWPWVFARRHQPHGHRCSPDANNHMAIGVRQTPPTTWPWVFAS